MFFHLRLKCHVIFFLLNIAIGTYFVMKKLFHIYHDSHEPIHF